MINDVERAIQDAIASNQDSKKINKAYLEFIKANFIVPVENYTEASEPEVLFLVEQDQPYLPVFSNMDAFDNWAKPIADKIQLLKLSGVDLLKGIEENVHIAFNIGSPFYKTFLPEEIARMKGMVLKFFK